MSSYLRSLLDKSDDDRRVIEEYRKSRRVDPFEDMGEDESEDNPLTRLRNIGTNLWREFRKKRDEMFGEPVYEKDAAERITGGIGEAWRNLTESGRIFEELPETVVDYGGKKVPLPQAEMPSPLDIFKPSVEIGKMFATAATAPFRERSRGFETATSPLAAIGAMGIGGEERKAYEKSPEAVFAEFQPFFRFPWTPEELRKEPWTIGAKGTLEVLGDPLNFIAGGARPALYRQVDKILAKQAAGQAVSKIEAKFILRAAEIDQGISRTLREAAAGEAGALGRPATVLKKLVPPALEDTASKIGLDIEVVEGLAEGTPGWVAISRKTGTKYDDAFEARGKWLSTKDKDTEKFLEEFVPLTSRFAKGKKPYLPFKTLEDAQKFLETGDPALVAKKIELRGRAWTPEELASTERQMAERTAKEQARLKANQPRIEAIDKQIAELRAKQEKTVPRSKTASRLYSQIRELKTEKDSLLRFPLKAKSYTYPYQRPRMEGKPGTGKVVPQVVKDEEGNVIFESWVSKEGAEAPVTKPVPPEVLKDYPDLVAKAPLRKVEPPQVPLSKAEGAVPKRPMVNPRASAIQQDKQKLAQIRWDKEHKSPEVPPVKSPEIPIAEVTRTKPRTEAEDFVVESQFNEAMIDEAIKKKKPIPFVGYNGELKQATPLEQGVKPEQFTNGVRVRIDGKLKVVEAEGLIVPVQQQYLSRLEQVASDLRIARNPSKGLANLNPEVIAKTQGEFDNLVAKAKEAGFEFDRLPDTGLPTAEAKPPVAPVKALETPSVPPPPKEPPTAVSAAPEPKPLPKPSVDTAGKLFMADLQSAEEAVDIAFQPNNWRKLGNLPVVRKITEFFNPAAVAADPAKKGVVLRAVLHDETQQKSAGVMAHLWELGDQGKMFGKLDDTGLLAEGRLKGFSVNKIRTYPGKYADKLTDVQKEWIKRADDIEKAKLDFLRRNDIEVNELTFAEGGQYAGRRVLAKVDSEGNIIADAMVGAGPGRPGAKTTAEKTRVFKDVQEAIAAGYRYLPEDEALSLNVQGAYNRVADKKMANWVLSKVPWRTTGAPEELVLAAESARHKMQNAQRFVGAVNRAVRGERVPDSTLTAISSLYPEGTAALKRQLNRIAEGKSPTASVVKQLTADAKSALADAKLNYSKAVDARARARELAMRPKLGEASVRAPAFAGKIFTGENAKDMAKVLNQAFEPRYVEVLGKVNKINAIQRYFALAGDASVFGIQLIMLPAFRPKVFGQAAKGFVKAFLSPEFGQSVLKKGKDIIDSSPNMIMSTGGRTEYTEAFARNGLLNPKAFRPSGEAMAKSVALAVPRAIGKAARFLLEPFQRGFETALDVTAIELKKSLGHMAKTPEQIAQLDQFINEFRGITSSARIGVTANQRALETGIFLAPRYNRAVAGVVLDLARGNLRGELARRAVGGAIASAVAMTIAIDLARGKGWEEIASHINPASNDFMTWEVAGQKVGPGSKVRSLIRLGGQIQQKIIEGKGDDLVEITMANPIARFLRGNLSAVASTSIDMVTGRTYLGEPSRDGLLSFSKNVLAENLVPIWMQSVLMEGGELGQRLLRGTSEFFGGRAYPDPEIERVNKALENSVKLGQPDTENLQKKIEKATTPEMKAYIQEKGDIFSTSDLATELKKATKYLTLDDMPPGKFPPIAYAFKAGEEAFARYEGIPPDKREDFRRENPNVDAHLFFWGKVTSTKTGEAREIAENMIRQYGIPENAVPGMREKVSGGTSSPRIPSAFKMPSGRTPVRRRITKSPFRSTRKRVIPNPFVR